MTLFTATEAGTLGLIDPTCFYDAQTTAGLSPQQAFNATVSAIKWGGHRAAIAAMTGHPDHAAKVHIAALDWAGMGWPPPWTVEVQ